MARLDQAIPVQYGRVCAYPDFAAQPYVEYAGNEQYLYQLLTGRRDMNPAEARRLEEESGGELTRRMLCQKTWHRIWPELVTEEFPAPDEQEAA